VTFSGGIRNLIVFGDISFKIQCTRLVLIGYKNVTGDIQKSTYHSSSKLWIRYQLLNRVYIEICACVEEGRPVFDRAIPKQNFTLQNPFFMT
jgi:hypothetical protein